MFKKYELQKGRPLDILFVGDSMIKNFQVYGHKSKVWKFCYPGGTAEELHGHISSEKLPGEIHVGTVLICIGTNDLSRSRNRFRSTGEIFRCLNLFTLKMAKMYPQANIVFCSILPRVDCDNDRVINLNNRMKCTLLSRESRFQYYDGYKAFVKEDGDVEVSYFRDSETDSVHLSDSGTQVQQDVLNKLLEQLHRNMYKTTVDFSLLLWQRNWEHFNMFNAKSPGDRKNNYLEGKRLTNFTETQHEEILKIEDILKTNKDF